MTPYPAKKVSAEAAADVDASRGMPYSIVVACGPYCPSNTLDFSAFSQLIKTLVRNPPDVLILTGPFLDVDNSAVVTSLEDCNILFRDSFSKFLLMLDRVGCRVVVVPSVTDMTASTCMLPQTPFSEKLFPDSTLRYTVLAPNPCILQLDNGMTIGVTSTDVIGHMSSSFVQPPGMHPDRLKDICSTLVAERSFYPLRPCHESVAIHTNYSNKLFFPGITPDLLVLPSSLVQFAYTLPLPKDTSCTCVNPGRLVRGNVLGSYMHIVADPVTHQVTRVSKMQL